VSSIGPDDLAAAIRTAEIAIGDRDPADVTSLRDILWLAAAIAARTEPGAEQADEVIPAQVSRVGEPRARDGGESSTRGRGGRPDDVSGSEAKLFDADDTDSGGTAGAAQARPVDLAGPAALRERLELARALRPFRRTVPSRHRKVLDVEATVRASAATRRTLPILRPAAERRFSADLVFDASPSMEVWDDIFDQLAGVFRHAGAFSEVREWRLHADDKRDEVWLTDRNRYHWPPAALRSADGRRVVLMMTDGVGDHWYARGVWACLADWGSRGPMALVDPLPVKLWSLSGIGSNRVRVRASSSGAPNIDLNYKQPRVLTRAGKLPQGTMPVPVAEFSPAALMAWSATVADAHPDGCVAVLVRAESRQTMTVPRPGDADAEGSLANFVHTASPAALRLAILAAVSEAVDLAVLRAIQDEMLPGSSTSDLAEVLVSGIFWQVPDPDGQVGLRIRMDPSCRAQLRERASVQDWWDVYRAVSAAFARSHPASASRFRAAVLDPSGDVRVPAGQRAFAEVARAALAGAREGARPVPVPVPAAAPAMRMFLSYAEEDGAIASEVAAVLASLGLDVFSWQDPRRERGQFIRQIEEEISRADAFLILLSPSYLASAWCSRERALAQAREVSLAGDGAPGFVHVLLVREIPRGAGGFLGSYDWIDLTVERDRARALSGLGRRLAVGRAGSPPEVGTGNGSEAPTAPVFRDRADELDRVMLGLASRSGPAFWLVVAPPQLGKTWFLHHVSDLLGTREPDGWTIRLLDVRDHGDVRDDAQALLGRLAGREAVQPPSAAAMVGDIAKQIARSGRPQLFLLDSAEFLAAETARELRSALSEIYRNVADMGGQKARFGLIVASRRDDHWRGVVPVPRINLLSLTAFRPQIIFDAVRDLARQMDRIFSLAEFERTADRVCRLTEGLPALLAGSLKWIRDRAWVGLDRLERQDVFEDLARPYIEGVLLAADSLFPGASHPQEAELHALRQAFRVLAPYRLVTQSHLRHCRERDRLLRWAMNEADWSPEDLWQAFSDSALLERPLNEPWQEISAPIRRLLFRYYYRSDSERAAAHREASNFVSAWTARQSGREQVIGLSEYLWHQAAALRIQASPAEMAQQLTESAVEVARILQSSAIYTESELRDYAARRIREDDEFQEVVDSVPGLAGRVEEAVVRPPREPSA
jgi:hypothetical protein